MRSERGQGTIEYGAAVLLVACVMIAAIAGASASGIGPQVVREMRRAICVVTGEACDVSARLAARPCVLASARHESGGHLTILFLRAGSRHVVLREERSDGRVALTLVDGSEIGIDVGAGVGAHVRWGTSGMAVGSELRAAVLAGAEDGRTWVARDAAHAGRLFERIQFVDRFPRARTAYPIPDPVVTYSERSSELSLDFHAGGRQAATLSVQDAYGERLDHQTGRRTVYVRDAAEGGIGLSYGRWSARAGGADADRIGITYDRHGRPVDLMVLSTADVEGSASLPPRLSRIAGYLRIPLSGAKHIETEQHLDLTDAQSAAVAHDYLAALGDDRLGIRVVAEALRDRLDERGTVSVRTYASDASAHEVGGSVKLGPIGVGGEIGSEDETSTLQAAVSRRPDGSWGEDPACAVAA